MRKYLCLFILLLFFISGCSVFDNEVGNEIRFSNDASKEVVVVAIEESLAHQMDISGYMEVEEDDPRIINPGNSYSLSIENIEGDFGEGTNLHIFIYSDPPDFERGERENHRKIFYQDQFRIFNYNELIDTNFRILISEVKTDY